MRGLRGSNSNLFSSTSTKVPETKFLLPVSSSVRWKRSFSFQAVIHIIDDVLRCENHIGANVSQRQM
jgi:hypothetical protein